MRVLASCAAAAMFLLAFAAPVSADAMRCGSKLVSNGDTRAKVRQMCGAPTDVQTRTILRRPYYDFHGRLVYFGDGLIEIPVEIWTYNFGPYKLMRRVRFFDGLVEDIDTLGYGYHGKPTDDSSAREDSTPRETYR
jgi:hypothetical protein